MADNIGYTPGTGATVAADDVSGVLYQRVKLAFGADGSANDVASGNGLPVDTGLLERENIAFKRFYADLLQQQIEEQRTAQIRLQLELLGIYQQIEEEDEQAIMLMMMEL